MMQLQIDRCANNIGKGSTNHLKTKLPIVFVLVVDDVVGDDCRGGVIGYPRAN